MNKREIMLSVLCVVFAAATLLLLVGQIDAGSRMQAMRRTIAKLKDDAETLRKDAVDAHSTAERRITEIKLSYHEKLKSNSNKTSLETSVQPEILVQHNLDVNKTSETPHSVIVAQEPTETQAKRIPDENIEFSFSGSTVTVKNKNNYTWKNLRVAINPGVFGRGYKTNKEILRPGESYRISTTEFADSKHIRFDQSSSIIEEFTVAFERPDGHRVFEIYRRGGK